MFSSTCQLWTLLVYTAKDPWPPFRNIAIVRHSRPTLSQQCWTVWKVNIFTRLKSMLLKLLLLMFCFIPCFPSSIRLNNPVRKWGPSPHVSGIPVDLTWDATDFDPGNGRSAAENSRPICETRDCFFITAVQSYSSTQLYSTYAQIIDFLMNTSILPPVYTTMPYLGQPGLVFRGVDVPILLHVLRLMILSKIINLVNLLALGKDLKISHTNITWNKHYYSKQICHVTYHIHSHAYYFPNKHSNKWVTTFRVVKLEVPNWV